LHVAASSDDLAKYAALCLCAAKKHPEQFENAFDDYARIVSGYYGLRGLLDKDMVTTVAQADKALNRMLAKLFNEPAVQQVIVQRAEERVLKEQELE
jgi:hypothetical protein